MSDIDLVLAARNAELTKELEAARWAKRTWREQAEAAKKRVAELEAALPPAANLEWLADWLDGYDARHHATKGPPPCGGTVPTGRQVQRDLRAYAEAIRKVT